eukprot:TRINITY_DN4006_c0_g1_i2.p3 TRINITY_DN4006_c0_g1~~TRINITY_DN4006_c0_g1_i2.p3  ORF type:complete len:215 (-),score=4.91 TRINITY_DN4006_c0_g1_i2:1382-2026(-)
MELYYCDSRVEDKFEQKLIKERMRQLSKRKFAILCSSQQQQQQSKQQRIGPLKKIFQRFRQKAHQKQRQTYNQSRYQDSGSVMLQVQVFSLTNQRSVKLQLDERLAQSQQNIDESRIMTQQQTKKIDLLQGNDQGRFVDVQYIGQYKQIQQNGSTVGKSSLFEPYIFFDDDDISDVVSDTSDVSNELNINRNLSSSSCQTDQVVFKNVFGKIQY